ncbi:MAG TPA: exonuclease domain-containing protein [Solirubrobacteraceae bacterium]|jgi:DNA polymerase-3 subunit epsilon|nr:exonuclease domain-containing protein [Solirubrobacteraceae bacterium]
MDLLSAPIATAEFIVVDTETNGLAGDDCELTEVGAVLVGGGELHDRWSSLCRTSAPLRRGIQRLTGITQAMLDGAPSLEDVLPPLSERLEGRVLVAHNAPFDRRVLRQAFGRIGLEWPDPPVICTAAMARSMLPLQRRRGLGVLADALGIEVHTVHRALADAETCARVLCALFPRLCAHAATIGDALAMLAPGKRARKRPVTRSLPPGSLLAPAPGGPARLPRRPRGAPGPDFAELPRDPGVYLFRDEAGRVLYVGKSVSIRSRARAHFAPSSPPAAWTRHATVVDYRTTGSELGALILENRLIKELKPPGNKRLTRRDDRLVYIRCRLDIPFPILEVAPDPAAGHAVTVGPVRGRRLALELVEQLDSLFGLRHCGRRLPRREHPSAYGQMGRCLSPCLGDLDPNLYRRRLDEVLALFVSEPAGSGQPLLAHVYGQMRAAAARERFERAESLRRRAGRLRTILDRLGGVLEATHARPRLVLAPHPGENPSHPPEAFWMVGGRLVDLGPPAEGEGGVEDLVARTEAALRREGRAGDVGAHVPPDEVDEVRILGTWLASHPDTPQLMLRPAPDRDALNALWERARAAAPPASDPAEDSGGEGKLDDDGVDLVGADRHV